MSKGTDQEMSRVVGVKIENHIIELRPSDNQSRCIIARRDVAERTLNFIPYEGPILSFEIGHSVWRPQPLPPIRDPYPRYLLSQGLRPAVADQ